MILIGTQQNVVKDVFNAYNQAVIYSLFALHPNKKIAKIKCTNKKQKGNTRDQQRTAFIYSGSPFSYNGQCFIYKSKKKFISFQPLVGLDVYKENKL